MFDPSTRGVANGIFSWGTYIGYGLTFVLGNYAAPADILGHGWRSTFVIGCAWGVPLGIVIFLYRDPRSNEGKNAVSPIEEKKEPTSVVDEKKFEVSENKRPKIKARDIVRQESPLETLGYWRTLLYSCVQPAMLLLFLAAAVRQTGE